MSKQWHGTNNNGMEGTHRCLNGLLLPSPHPDLYLAVQLLYKEGSSTAFRTHLVAQGQLENCSSRAIKYRSKQLQKLWDDLATKTFSTSLFLKEAAKHSMIWWSKRWICVSYCMYCICIVFVLYMYNFEHIVHVYIIWHNYITFLL